jgi:hypothetical protein
VPDDRIPICIDDQHSPARTQDAMQLSQRDANVTDVLVNLRRDAHIELFVAEQEPSSVTWPEVHPRPVCAPSLSRSEEALTDISATDSPGGSNCIAHFAYQEPRPCSDVDDTLTRTQLEHLRNGLPLLARSHPE